MIHAMGIQLKQKMHSIWIERSKSIQQFYFYNAHKYLIKYLQNNSTYGIDFSQDKFTHNWCDRKMKKVIHADSINTDWDWKRNAS